MPNGQPNILESYGRGCRVPRLREARDLLERTSLSISAIAMATGYSPQQLVRHFRQATGLPPREYRRLHSSRSWSVAQDRKN